MFTILYKLVVGWLMPPGCFIILFGYSAWKTRSIADPALRKTLRMLSLIGAAGLYLLSTQPVLQLLVGGLQNKYPVAQESQIKKTNVSVKSSTSFQPV